MDRTTEYLRALHAHDKALRAVGRFIVRYIEAGEDLTKIAPCYSGGTILGTHFDALGAIVLAPVGAARRSAAIKAYRSAFPAAA